MSKETYGTDLLENLMGASWAKTEAVKNFNSCYGGRIRRAFEIMEFIESKGDPSCDFGNWHFELWPNEGPMIVMQGGFGYESCDTKEHWIQCSSLAHNWDDWNSSKALKVKSIVQEKEDRASKHGANVEAREREQYEKLKAKFEGDE